MPLSSSTMSAFTGTILSLATRRTKPILVSMADKEDKRKVREATWAGIFYDDDPAQLSRDVDRLLDSAAAGAEAAVTMGDAASAILSPHASLEYSGDLAALAWNACRNRKLSRIVLIGPWHRATESALWLPESLSYEGPFGSIDVDRRCVTEFMDCGTIYSQNDIPHLEEHSIEVQLPFVARLFPGVPIVPLLVGLPSSTLVKALASGLGLVFGKRRPSTLFVLSSDLEFAQSPEESAARSGNFLARIESGDWESLLEDQRAGKLASCGIGGIAGYLASGLAGVPRLLGRHGSGAAREREDDAHGEYAAIAFE